jgi:hypothetical protein
MWWTGGNKGCAQGKGGHRGRSALPTILRFGLVIVT